MSSLKQKLKQKKRKRPPKPTPTDDDDDDALIASLEKKLGGRKKAKDDDPLADLIGEVADLRRAELAVQMRFHLRLRASARRASVESERAESKCIGVREHAPMQDARAQRGAQSG